MKKIILCPNHLGDPKHLSLQVVELLRNAETIICDTESVFNDNVINYFNIDTTNKNIIAIHSTDFDEGHLDPALNLKVIKNALEVHDEVVVIPDGGMLGIADYGADVVVYARSNDIELEVIPGCSIIPLANLSAGIGNDSDEVHQAAVFGLPEEEIIRRAAEEWSKVYGTIIILHRPEQTKIVYDAISRAFSPETPYYLGINLATSSEEFVEGSIETCKEKINNISIYPASYTTTVIAGKFRNGSRS